MTNQLPLVHQEGKEIFFTSFSNPRVVQDFIDLLNQNVHNLKREFILNFKKITTIYPNTAVPIAGIVESLSQKGFKFHLYYMNEVLEKSSIEKPIRVCDNQGLVQNHCLSRIWRFESANDTGLLINSFRDELFEVLVAEKGVIEGFEWALSEVLDNVLQHSSKDYGYVMGQVHRAKKNFSFCVFDTGQGIYNSLLHSVHKPQTPLEAIKLSIREGITRDKRIGQGNGLWGLHQIVRENAGQLNITSDSACYSAINGTTRTLESLPLLPYEKGCIIDFQLNYAKEISISNALGGHELTNYKVENYEDDFGQIIYELSKKDSGTGTRKSGERIRNELINLHKQSGKQIVLDFSRLNVIASSFADELIGKLVVEFGFYGFNNIFKLIQMNPTIQTIVQRSVAQRMMESFNGDNND